MTYPPMKTNVFEEAILLREGSPWRADPSIPYSNSTCTSSSIYSLSSADDAMMMHTWILTGDASPATGDASPVASETYGSTQ